MSTSLADRSDHYCVVNQSEIGSALVLAVSGVLDMVTAADFADAIDRALDKRPGHLVIDLSDVNFLASHGMSLIVDAYHRAGSNTSVAVVADGPVTARPLVLIGIAEMVPLHRTLDDALAGLTAA